MSDLLLQGFNLVVYGMGTVFLFLTMLVGVTTLMSKVLRDSSAPATGAASRSQPAVEADTQVLAAVTAAVDAYRRRHP